MVMLLITTLQSYSTWLLDFPIALLSETIALPKVRLPSSDCNSSVRRYCKAPLRLISHSLPYSWISSKALRLSYSPLGNSCIDRLLPLRVSTQALLHVGTSARIFIRERRRSSYTPLQAISPSYRKREDTQF